MFQVYNSILFLFTKYITEQIQFYPVESRRQVSYYSIYCSPLSLISIIRDWIYFWQLLYIEIHVSLTSSNVGVSYDRFPKNKLFIFGFIPLLPNNRGCWPINRLVDLVMHSALYIQHINTTAIITMHDILAFIFFGSVLLCLQSDRNCGKRRL